MNKRFEEIAVRLGEKFAKQRMSEDQKKLFLEKVSENSKLTIEILETIEKSFKRSKGNNEQTPEIKDAMDELKELASKIFW